MKIKPLSELKVGPAIKLEGIISTRIAGTNQHFGNPFSSDARILAQNLDLIKTSSTRESVERYIDWVLESNEERAVWIREQLQSGQLKGKPIFYYRDLGEPSHATALDYLINKYPWNEGNWEQEARIPEIEATYERTFGVDDMIAESPELLALMKEGIISKKCN